jgi:hypothetical protein
MMHVLSVGNHFRTSSESGEHPHSRRTAVARRDLRYIPVGRKAITVPLAKEKIKSLCKE